MSQINIEHHAATLESFNRKGLGNLSSEERIEYNRLVQELNQYYSDLDSVSIEDQFSDLSSMSSELESNKSRIGTIEDTVAQECAGIVNVLKGVVNNARKGKMSLQKKEYMLAILNNVVKELQAIDVEEAIKEKQNRISMYSSINSRL